MTEATRTEIEAWEDATRRATAVVDRERPGGMKEDSWDGVAIRDIIAMVLYALHTRHKTPATEVPWSRVLWWLWDDEHVIALVEDTLPDAGRALTTPDSELTDPVLARWRWLNRTWDPQAPRNVPPPPWEALLQRGRDAADRALPEPRWDGMSRGIAAALPDPALEVCTHWAAGAVTDAFSAEQGGLAVHQRVRVHAGAFAGQGGYVRDIGWAFDDTAQQVTGPAGYVVDLDNVPGTEHIDADLLKPARDRRWPRRPGGTLKDGPPPVVHAPPPPTLSCAEHLERLLTDAENPEAVPEGLREQIRGTRHHFPFEMRQLASPRPHRRTAQLVLHRYQLVEGWVEDPAERADIWELVLTEHLRDKEPVLLLATTEEAAKALAAQRTGLEL